MKVTFRDHDGKGARLGAALTEAGHQLVPSGGEVALVDSDAPIDPYRTVCDAHDRVMVYPHGGGHPFTDDGWPIHPNTVCRFVPGPGQVDVLRLCGYDGRLEVIGWPTCDLLPFRPTATPVEVLFAPMHALPDGFMPAGAREANARTHDLLAALPIRLIVRHVPVTSLESIGVTRRPGVDYRDGSLDVNAGNAAIDAADVVVAAEGTFPSLAVARGCPTVMCAQVPFDAHVNGIDEARVAARWDRYKDDIRYPLDADHCTEPEELMALLVDACRDDTAVAVWRERFVGAQFDPEAFVKTFEAAA